MRFDDVAALWREGQRRLAEADPADKPALERVTDEIVLELRRRLGGPFTTQELADLYVQQGTDWCFDVAVRAAPGNPAAWDLTTVAGRGVRPLRPRGERLRRRAADLPRPAARTIVVVAVAVVVVGVVVRLVAAGAADDDLVLFDHDLDRAMTSPVLGVGRVVLDGRVEPQAVALVAVIERAPRAASTPCGVRGDLRAGRAGAWACRPRRLTRRRRNRSPSRPPPRRRRARRRSARRPRRAGRSRSRPARRWAPRR